MGRNVLLQISKNALRYNLQRIRHFAPYAKIIAMVKANAYGHGLTKVAKIIHDVDAFGVASIEEALTLRQAGIKTDIVLMEGIFRADELIHVKDHHLTMVVHHWQQVQTLESIPDSLNDYRFKVWIKINTGMNRLGFNEAEFQEAYLKVSSKAAIEIIGFMTHFSQADETENPVTQDQINKFYQIVGDRPGQKSLANSPGILAWPKAHADWVRPGLILYGASPFTNQIGKDFDLQPVMTLQSEIIAIRELPRHERVGYGGTWENPKERSKIGIVAMGYGDGYPWHAKNGTPVLVNGKRVGIVGRISMDMLAVDLSCLDKVAVGDPVILWGDALPIEEVARFSGTIPYELFCRFTERVKVEFSP